MKKVGFKRILFCILLHILLGIGVMVVSELLLNSKFSVDYIFESKTYDIRSVSLEEDSFEDTSIFTDIFSSQLQDILLYRQVCSIMNKADNDNTVVNVLAHNNYDISAKKNRNSLIYSVDDLVNWGRRGISYTKRSFNLKQFLYYFPEDKRDFFEVYDDISDYVTYVTNSDGDIVQVDVMMMVCPYSSVSGIDDISKVASSWKEYFEIRDCIDHTIVEYAEFYEIYKNGDYLYKTDNINLKYVIRMDTDEKTFTYGNYSQGMDINEVSDEEFTEIFTDKGNYIVYFPDELEFDSNVSIDERLLYNYVLLYSDKVSNIRLWAFVDDIVYDDAYYVASNSIKVRSNDIKYGALIAVTIFICWLVGFLFLLITAGIHNKKVYTLLADQVWLEIYILLFVGVIVLLWEFCKRLIDGTIFNLVVGDAPSEVISATENVTYSFSNGTFLYHFGFWFIGFIFSIIACLFSFSVVRRIRNGLYFKDSLLYLVNRGFGNMQSKIDNSDNVLLASIIPYNVFIIVNFLLMFLAFFTYTRAQYVRFSLIAIILIAVDVSVGVRQYKKLSDQKTILDGIRTITGGDFDFKIDEKDFHGTNVEMAESINALGAGIKAAVADSIKNENMKSDLITNVSHDLKTPLTSIINYVDLLKKEGITQEPALGYINTLDDKSRRLKVLLEDLIEASRVSSGNIEVHFQKLAVSELIHQVVAEYVDKLDEKKLTVVFVGDSKPKIEADGRLMWRIFDNLFVNILKYSMYGTRVYVDLQESDSQIRISVKNVSATVNTIQGSELTEKFIRGDSSRTTEGSGLGLFISKSLVELQNGIFEVIADGDLFKVNLIFNTVEDKEE